MQAIAVTRTGDKYGSDYVGRLYKMLMRNTTIPFVFVVHTETKYPGWWGKIEYFPPTERLIALDLDIVITGNVDFLFDYDGPFCAWKDPWADGMNTSVMSIAPGFGDSARRTFDGDSQAYMRQYHSDQQFLDAHVDPPEYWPNGLIQSYKADNLADGPGDARIVVFHGKPKMDDLDMSHWARKIWEDRYV